MRENNAVVILSYSILVFFFQVQELDLNAQSSVHSVMAVINLLPLNFKFMLRYLTYENVTRPFKSSTFVWHNAKLHQ